LKSSPGIRLCGLGPAPSENATLEAVEALRSCALVYSDLRDEGPLSFLDSPRGQLKLRARDAKEILAQAETKAVGVAVLGHPLLTSRLGREVAALARKTGVPCEVFPGPSPLGEALSRAMEFLGGEEGCPGAQVLALEDALAKKPVDPRFPLVLFSPDASAEDWTRAARAFAARYPQSPEPLVYGGVAVWGFTPAPEREGAILRSAGRREEAVDALRRALAAAPECAPARAVLGEVLRELGGRRKGYAEVQAAVRLDPKCSYATARLKAVEPGRDEAWIFGCRGGGLRLEDDLDGARRDLEKAVELDCGCGWAWGWLGEVLMRRGDHAAALDALNRAVALFAEWPEAYLWRGETLRRLGRGQEAAADLEQAVALGYRNWDVFVSRGTIALEGGDQDRYLAEMTEALRAAPEVFEKQAKESNDPDGSRWVMDALGRIREGERLLSKGKVDEALSADPGSVTALLARAERRRDGGLLREALEDADRAVKLAPSGDAYALRADLGQRLGFMEQALRDLSVAVALSPNANWHQWRAQTFIGMRHYDLAMKETSAALELEPDNWYLYDLRAHILMLLGRLAQAQDDVERALKMCPAQVNLHLRLGQNLALQGKFSQALASLAPIREKHPAWARFITGYIRSVEKDYGAAMKEFSAAQAAAGTDEHLKNQSIIYGTVAKAMAAKLSKKGRTSKADAKKLGRVFLCGLGVYPPQTATVEVLRALGECDVVFNNLPGIGMSEFLGLFCANRRPVAFRYEQDAKLCADLVLSEAKPGRTVAFVTFGHPLLFGPLSNEIIQRCRKEGIPCKAFGAVSSMDAVLAASGQVLGFSYGGFQLFESMGLRILDEIEKASPRLPMVVYFADGMSDEWLESLTKILAKNYSSDYQLLFYGPRHELWETQQQKLTVAELGKTSHHKLAQGILFVPPKK